MIVRKRVKELKKREAKKTTGPLGKLKIWILYPFLETEDPNLQYYYDFSQSQQEYSKVFTELNADWTWQPVTMKNFR